jgi:uncharacterized phosphosugar-binding protein
MAVQQAADLMADSVASGDLVHWFGAGHSSLPVAEAYPKCGISGSSWTCPLPSEGEG